MRVVTYSQARANLKALMDEAVDDADRVVITRQRGKPVVMMSLEEAESLDTTAYLLSTAANARSLRQGIDDLDAGRTVAIDPATMQPLA